MSKSKSENALQRVTEERDYWKNLATQRKSEIAALERKLERNIIWGKAFAGGVNSIEENIDVLQQERDGYKEQLDEVMAENYRLRDLNNKLHDIEHAMLPPLIGSPPNHVSISMGYKTNDEGADFFKMNLDYPGTQEEFEREVLPQIMAALGRTPTLLDVGKQSIPGVSAEEFLKVLAYLTPYWYIPSLKTEFNNKRYEVFNHLYKQMDEAVKNDSTFRERNGLRVLFNEAVKDSFTRAEKRQKNALSMAKVDM